jgi:outer membrane protein assembly factor BamB
MPLVLLALALTSPPADWREFRGPDGAGLYSGPALPTEWGPDKNVVWVTPVPGQGWSSPILVGGKLILTTAVPLGESRNADQSLRAVAYDFATGKQLWEVELLRAPAALAEQKHKKNGHASPTPASDGKVVVCHFGHMGTAAVDLAGKVLWTTRELGYRPLHGNGASPVIVDDLAVVACDGSETAFVAALELATGKVRWRTDRKTDARMKFSFATPGVVAGPDGKKVLVSPASDYCMGYDPHTGTELWRCKYPQPGWSLICRPVFAHGLVYVSTGYMTPHLLAIDPFKTGEVKPTFDWKVKTYAPNTPTPLVAGDELYLVADAGFLSCVDARTGRTHYTERLAGKAYSASPIAADGKLYLTSEEGVGQVVALGKEFNEISRSELGEKTFATFVPAAGSLVVRTESKLYRFASK